jgi:hypothetical protein
MCSAKQHVRFTPESDRESRFRNGSCLLYPESGHVQRTRERRLWAKSGHRPINQSLGPREGKSSPDEKAPDWAAVFGFAHACYD